MANEIKDKYSASTAFSITLTGLAGSSLGVGRQSALVDNSVTRYQKLLIYARVQQSGTVSGNHAAYIYGLREDNAGHISDSLTSGDASATFLNAPIIGVIGNKSSPNIGDYTNGEFIFDSPGPRFGVGVTQDQCSILSNNPTGQWVRWVGVDPEVQ
jgi:hypothetical protein